MPTNVSREELDAAADWIDAQSSKEGPEIAAGLILSDLDLDRLDLEAHVKLRVEGMTNTACSAIAAYPTRTTELLEMAVKTAYEYGALAMLRAVNGDTP